MSAATCKAVETFINSFSFLYQSHTPFNLPFVSDIWNFHLPIPDVLLTVRFLLFPLNPYPEQGFDHHSCFV